MKKIFDIFKIKKEERVSALVALIIACALNALTVIKYHSQFSQITDIITNSLSRPSMWQVSTRLPIASYLTGTQNITYTATRCWRSSCISRIR